MPRDLTAPEPPAIDEVVVAIHGILAPATSPTWPERLANAWAARPHSRRYVITTRYAEGPWPRIAWLRNRGRTLRILSILSHLSGQLSRHGSMPPTRLHLVGHSNGALIALQVALALAARARSPWTLGTLALIAPALPAGPATRKVAALLEGGALEFATLYRAANDRALALTDLAGGLLALPWGSLGLHGWHQEHALAPSAGMDTRDFRRGHTGFFARRGHEGDYEDLAAERATFDLLDLDLDSSPVSAREVGAGESPARPVAGAAPVDAGGTGPTTGGPVPVADRSGFYDPTLPTFLTTPQSFPDCL